MAFEDELAEQSVRNPKAVAKALMYQRHVQLGSVFTQLSFVADEPIVLESLDVRSCNALRALGCETWADVSGLTVDQIWRAKNAGRKTVRRILIAAAERNAAVAERRPESAPAGEEPRRREVAPAVEPSAFARAESLLRELVAWAVTERDASRLIDLVSVSPKLGPVPPGLRSRLLKLGSELLHTFTEPEMVVGESRVCVQLLEEIGDAGDVFAVRHLRLENRPTLESVGVELGVTRERIRQIAARRADKAKALLDDPRFNTLSWRAFDLGNALGSAVPAESERARTAIAHAARGLVEPESCTVQDLMLWLAGPYVLRDGWLLKEGLSLEQVVTSFEAGAGEAFLVSTDEALGSLADLRISDLNAEELVQLVPGWRHIGDGWLVRWRGSVADKAEVVLRLVGGPLSVDEINSHIDEGHASGSIRNAFATDNRFMRLNKANVFGLRDWGLEEYSGIAQEIEERIERSGGVVGLDDVVIELTEQFGVSENSVRAYAYSPAFAIEAGMIRMRDDDDAYEVDGRTYKVRGLFVPREGEVILHVNVDADALRGSGRTLAEPAAAALGVHPGVRREFTHGESEASVVVSWPATATGPSLGSIRAIVECLGADAGDRIRLRFGRAAASCQAELVDATSLAGATGLDPPAGKEIEALAAAMGLDVASVRLHLQARGDDEVLRFLPAPDDSGLDEALAKLETVLG